MDKDKGKELLQRYRLGQCTPQEKHLVDQWYNGQAGLLGQEALPADDIEAIFESSKKRLKDIQRSGNTRRLRQYGKVAAVWALLLAIGGGILYGGFYFSREKYVTVIAGASLKRTLLPDGTLLVMNRGAVITYPQSFNKKTRDIVLKEGEAYFDVVPDAGKPFTVSTGNTTTRVLGTSFNIRSDKPAENTEISVISGKVSVTYSDAGKERMTILLPNQQLRLGQATGSMVVDNSKVAKATAWKDGIVRFDNEKLRVITQAMEDIYDVKISFPDARTGEQHFTIGFKASDNLTEILDLICASGQLTYEMKDRNIIFSSKKN